MTLPLVQAEEQRTPEAAFGLLSTQLRVDILQALAEEPDRSLSFSEIRERVGEPDSGKFNYHLRKLDGAFVRKDDAGYGLTFAGRQVVGAILAGTYTTSVTVDPIEVDGRCPLCDGPIEASYEDEDVLTTCTDCAEWRNRFTFPPATVVQFAPEELPGAFERWLRTTFGRIVDGFCANCAGRTAGRLLLPGTDEDQDQVRAHYQCDRCGSSAEASLVILLIFHPAGIAFYHDHGVDVTTTPTWQLATPGSVDVTVEDTDPPSTRLTLTLDGDELSVTVHEDLTLEQVNRATAN